MIEKLSDGPHIRFMADALLGLAVFGGLTVALLGPTSAAELLPIHLVSETHSLSAALPLAAVVPALAHAPAGATDPHTLVLLLAVVFSTLFALNLSFIRHIATAYRVASRPARLTNQASTATNRVT